MRERQGKGGMEGPEPHARGIERGIERLELVRKAKESARAAGDLRGQKARGWTEKVLTRTATGAVYAILTVVCLFWGKVPTAVLVTAMAWTCCSEFFRMSRMGGHEPNEILGLGASILFTLAPLASHGSATLYVLLLMMVLCAVWYVMTPRAGIADVALTAFGPIYTSLMFSTIVTIRSAAPGFDGGLLAFGVMGSVWLNDATAYFVGTRFGRHKLAPKISPNKSIEGLFGGLAGSVLIWLVMAVIPVSGIGWPLALVAGPVVGIMAVAGDLFESRVKRGVGVKDSGNVLPGHGGLLDRSDSMLFGCAVAFLLLRLGGVL
ncbi:phosphatidate cytidylyltransferase [Olsenella urininfantis]|uniref:phosphatidate cytidylyltransferase n=1 Tax=Olsenella urininfantis TaxID=1871033 RepID=UPI0009871CE1|nr:phosphatidate cytidylyltransferase [Olsenella urininfantis]